ncbi:MAG: hypothetical protein HY291_12355 [Planctomycetes bacterium]|nr:hypothetical protein [Planctomycetota bacterium]
MADEIAEPGEEGEAGEYAACPVCKGVGKGCRYCDGFGDVHPDDVRSILRAAKEEQSSRQKMFIGIGLCLVLGIAIAAVQIMRAERGSEQDEKPLDAITPAEAIEEMQRNMNLGTTAGYKRVIRVGEKVLPRATALEEQKVMLRMIDDAKEKLSLGKR